MSETVKKYQAEGAKKTVLQACHIFNMESVLMRKKCQKEGIPHTKPEADCPTSNSSRIKTRLAVFIEML